MNSIQSLSKHLNLKINLPKYCIRKKRMVSIKEVRHTASNTKIFRSIARDTCGESMQPSEEEKIFFGYGKTSSGQGSTQAIKIKKLKDQPIGLNIKFNIKFNIKAYNNILLKTLPTIYYTTLQERLQEEQIIMSTPWN